MNVKIFISFQGNAKILTYQQTMHTGKIFDQKETCKNMSPTFLHEKMQKQQSWENIEVSWMQYLQCSNDE